MALGQLRSNKATVVVIGAVIFLAALVGLAYNHLDTWELPAGSRLVLPFSILVFPLDCSPVRPVAAVCGFGSVSAPPPCTLQKQGGGEESVVHLEANANLIFLLYRTGSNTPASSAKPGQDIDTSGEDLMEFYLKSIQKPSVKPSDSTYSPYGAFEWKLPEAGDDVKWNEELGEEFCIIDLDNRPFDEEGQLWNSEPMSFKLGKKLHGISMGFINHWLYGMAPADALICWRGMEI